MLQGEGEVNKSKASVKDYTTLLYGYVVSNDDIVLLRSLVGSFGTVD